MIFDEDELDMSTTSTESAKGTEPGRILLLVIVLILLAVLVAPRLLRQLDTGEEYPCAPLSEYSGVYPMLADSGSIVVRFAWLADGETILYQDGEGQLYSVVIKDGESSSSQRLAGLTGYWMGLSESPDLIALSDVNETVHVYQFQVAQPVAAFPEAIRGVWLPGQTVLVITNRETRRLELIDLEDSDHAVRLARYRTWIFPVAWSSDGRFLAGTTGVFRSGKIVIVSRDDGKVKLLTDLQRCQASPKWELRTNQVTYAANPDIQWDIFTQSWPDGEPLRLVHTDEMDEYQPSWSPDGSQIVYVGVSIGSENSLVQEIYAVDISGGQIRQLTNSANEHESLPLWSPQGNKIAFLSVHNNQWYLNAINPDGSNQQRITTISQ